MLTNRLVNPHHVGQVGPRERVSLRRVCSRLPQERAVLLQQATHGATARAAVEENGDLIAGSWVLGWEEPEKQLILAGAVG